MTALERYAWQSFRNVVHGFLGRNKADNYEDSVETLMQTYYKRGSRISLKMHYLHSHLDFFRPNLTAVSEDHGERFHQDIQVMRKRYQGRWDEAMMGSLSMWPARQSPLLRPTVSVMSPAARSIFKKEKKVIAPFTSPHRQKSISD